jgi:hypothetical protein
LFLNQLLPSPQWKLVIDIGIGPPSAATTHGNPAEIQQAVELMSVIRTHSPESKSSPKAMYLPGFTSLYLLLGKQRRTAEENDLVKSSLESYSACRLAGYSDFDVAWMTARHFMEQVKLRSIVATTSELSADAVAHETQRGNIGPTNELCQSTQRNTSFLPLLNHVGLGVNSESIAPKPTNYSASLDMGTGSANAFNSVYANLATLMSQPAKDSISSSERNVLIQGQSMNQFRDNNANEIDLGFADGKKSIDESRNLGKPRSDSHDFSDLDLLFDTGNSDLRPPTASIQELFLGSFDNSFAQTGFLAPEPLRRPDVGLNYNMMTNGLASAKLQSNHRNTLNLNGHSGRMLRDPYTAAILQAYGFGSTADLQPT